LVHPPTNLWGIHATLTPLPGGHRNKVFRTMGQDRDVVFKTTRRNPDSIAWLTHVLHLAEQSGFIVPHLIASQTGRFIEHGWICEPFIHGVAFTPSDMPGIVQPLARFHAASTNIQQRPGCLSARDFLIQDRGGDIDLSAMPAPLVVLCRKAWSQIAAQPTCVIHGDLTPANLIRSEDHRIALVDWDECRVDVPLFDDAHTGVTATDEATQMAVLAWEIACSWRLEPDYAQCLADKLTAWRP
jgi:Ser/Thr protein kinase RdoA (MazF antagonist)